MEVPLPASGLGVLDSPCLFPTPPSIISSSVNIDGVVPSIPPRIEQTLAQQDDERVWFIYLADVSITRTIARVLRLIDFASIKEAANVNDILERILSLEDEIGTWSGIQNAQVDRN